MLTISGMNTPLKAIIGLAGGVFAVARACNIKHPAVCQWVAGSRPVPIWHARTLAALAGVDIGQILPYVRAEARQAA